MTTKSTEISHPFDEPCHFGEDGEWIVIRGDISASDAAQRISDFEEKCGASNVLIKPETLAIAKVFLRRDSDGCEEWIMLFYNQDAPETAEKVIEVWSHDNY